MQLRRMPKPIAPYCCKNHGPVAWGRSLEEAFHRLEAVEHYAQITYNTYYVLGQACSLNDSQIAELKAIRNALGFAAGPLHRGVNGAAPKQDKK